jgi:cyclic dehypoxanthinyl futalosine synthase
MSDSKGSFLRAGERIKQAQREDAAPGVVLEELLAPDATADVRPGEVRRKVEEGERITPQEGLWLLTEAPLIEMGEMAQVWRFRHNPERQVTFVVDTNPNYTNYCDADCLFCAFYRKPGDNQGYAHSVDHLMKLVNRSVKLGATTVLLQGGLNPDLPLDYYLNVVRAFRERFPEVHPHLWSAPEIGKMSEVSGLGYEEVLAALYEAGQRTMPGGGAEILSDRVRARISPKKQSVLEWLEIHRLAHAQGFKTTATMMYGHAEQAADIIEHLEVIRRLQDETGGFTAFITWPFQADGTRLKLRDDTSPFRYLRVQALARLYIDNIPNIQVSWPTLGPEIGEIALRFGANDFGSVMIEENVVSQAGATFMMTSEEIEHHIRLAGFQPARRNMRYQLLTGATPEKTGQQRTETARQSP